MGTFHPSSPLVLRSVRQAHHIAGHRPSTCAIRVKIKNCLSRKEMKWTDEKND